MAHVRLSANEIAGPLISMMAWSTTLQKKAGYIDARPPTYSLSKIFLLPTDTLDAPENTLAAGIEPLAT
jgi:hypothetical protein